jgi:hypothetical protein
MSKTIHRQIGKFGQRSADEVRMHDPTTTGPAVERPTQLYHSRAANQSLTAMRSTGQRRHDHKGGGRHGYFPGEGAFC